MKTENPVILSALADRLGTLKAAASELDSQIEIVKGELILAGVPAVDGALFRATVSHCPGRETVNWQALAIELGASPADVARFTVSGVPFTTVRVSARRG